MKQNDSKSTKNKMILTIIVIIVILFIIINILVINNISILNGEDIFNFFKFNLKLISLLLTLYALMFTFNKFGELKIPPILIFKIKYKRLLTLLLVSIIIEILIIFLDILVPIPLNIYEEYVHYFSIEIGIEFILNFVILLILLSFLFAFFYESYNFVATNNINVKNLPSNAEELFALILSSSGEIFYDKFHNQYNFAIKKLNDKEKKELNNLIVENQKEIYFNDSRGDFLLNYSMNNIEEELDDILIGYYEENQYKLFARYTARIMLDNKNLNFSVEEMKVDTFLIDYQANLFEDGKLKNHESMYNISKFLDSYINEIKDLVKDNLLIGRYFLKLLLIKESAYDKDLYFKKFLTQILTDDYMNNFELFKMLEYAIVECEHNLKYVVNIDGKLEINDITKEFISFRLNKLDQGLLVIKSVNKIDREFLLEELKRIKEFKFEDMKFDRLELEKFKNEKSKEIIESYVLFFDKFHWLIKEENNSSGRNLYIYNDELNSFVELIKESNDSIIKWLEKQNIIRELGFYNSIDKKWNIKDVIGTYFNGTQYYSILFDENIEKQIKEKLDDEKYTIFKCKKDKCLKNILEMKQYYQKSIDRYIAGINEVEKCIKLRGKEIITKNKYTFIFFNNIVKHFFGIGNNIKDEYDILNILRNDEERKLYFKKLRKLSNVILINNLNAYIILYYVSLDTIYNKLGIKNIEYIQFEYSKNLYEFKFISTLFLQMFHIDEIKNGNFYLNNPEVLIKKKDDIKYLFYLSNRVWNSSSGYLNWEYDELDKVYRIKAPMFAGMTYLSAMDTRGIFNNSNLYALNEFYKKKFNNKLYDFEEFDYNGEKVIIENVNSRFDILLKKENSKKINYVTYRK